jgi:hypothetical protein
VVGQYDWRLVGKGRLDEFTPEDFSLLFDLVEPYKWRLTTPHILAECSNIADKCVRKIYHGDFRDFLRQLISTLDERWVSANELARSGEFRILGIADAAVCRAAEDGVRVISVDAQLCSSLWAKAADAENFNNLRDRLR